MAETSAADVNATERLHDYWEHGEGAALIRWGEPGDFQRCVDHLGKYIADPEGYCNLMHHRVTGAWPGHAPSETKTVGSDTVPAARSNKMATDLTYAYAADITKSERDENGDLLVYGKATGSDRDLDGQRCDPEWLKTAMPAWFEWANIREMHQPIAAGVGIELTNDGDDWYIKSRCVDQNTARKIEAGVLKGYSIGVKSPLIYKRDGDEWLAGGDICETSYVDRPCLPTAKTMICKMAGAELAPVEAVDAEVLTPAAMPTPKDLAARLSKAAEPTPEAPPEVEPTTAPTATPAPDDVPNPDPLTPEPPPHANEMVEEVRGPGREQVTKALTEVLDQRKAALPPLKPGGPPRYPITDVASLKDAIQAFGRAADGDKAKVKAHIKAEAKRLGASNLIPDSWKALLVKDAAALDEAPTHDPAALKAILAGLADCMKAEIDELCAGENELGDISQLLRTAAIFTSWWAQEAVEGETDPPFTDTAPTYLGLAADPTETKAAMTEQAKTDPGVEIGQQTPEPRGSVDTEALAELVKSAVATALAPSMERITALEADLAKVSALPEPGGPVITRTAMGRDADAMGVHAAIKELELKAATAVDPVLRRGYTERAAALKLKVA